MRVIQSSVVSLGALVLLAAAGPATAAPVVQTYAQAIGGQSAAVFSPPCTTFSAPAEVLSFFGSDGVANVVGGNAACGVAADTHTHSAASGSLVDSAALSTSFNAGANSFVGSASGNARPGKVGAEAHGTFSGSVNSLIVDGAQAFGLVRETMTETSPTHANGTPGSLVFAFTIDGKLATTNAATFVTTSTVDVRYQTNSGPIFTLMRGQANNSTSNPGLFAPTAGDDVAGFTVGPGTAIGADVFHTGAIDFIWGTPFDFTLALLAYVAPGTDGTGDVDFASSALLTGIDVRDAAGNPVTDFSIESGTATLYDASGVHFAVPTTTPEPATLALIGLGLAGLGFLRRRHAA